MHRLIAEVVDASLATVERYGNQTRITSGSGYLSIDWNTAAHVIVESDEIADRFKIPCRGCSARFEMDGRDSDMVLFNDYLLINERLEATGHFVIFDAQEGKLLFD
jgi:hypothetical protein